MDVQTFSAKELPAASAGWIAARAEPAIGERGHFTLAVSGGSTPAAMFAALAELDLPWGQIHVFQVDERVAPDGDPDRKAGGTDARATCDRRLRRLNGNRFAHPVRSLGSSSALRMSASSVRPI